MQQLEVDDRNTLKRWYTVEMRTPEEKIREVKDLFVKAGADKALKSAIKTYTDRALKQLDLMQIGSESSRLLQEFSTWLMTRNV